jgi:hypothetical protein
MMTRFLALGAVLLVAACAQTPTGSTTTTAANADAAQGCAAGSNAGAYVPFGMSPCNAPSNFGGGRGGGGGHR